MINFKGLLSINRMTHGYPEPDKMKILLADEKNHGVIFEITMGLEELMFALTARADMPCDVAVFGIENIGKKLYHSSILVPSSMYNYGDSKEKKKEILDSIVPEKWHISNYSDFGNFHRLKNGFYEVQISSYNPECSEENKHE